MVIFNLNFIPDINMSLCASYRCCCSYKWLCVILDLFSHRFSISDGRTFLIKISECTWLYYRAVAFVSQCCTTDSTDERPSTAGTV